MADLFLNVFSKHIDEITEADLISYFSYPQQESDTIEFKSYNKLDTAKESEKIGKIVRSVAAMLNSGGGLIIWGAPTPTKLTGTQEHIVQGNLAPVDFEIGKDRFMSILYSNISPSPKGIRFEPLKLASGGFIYLVEVQPSDYPPHQYDGRYYTRFDSLSKPAPHHYVEALMKQTRQPLVQGFLEFGPSEGGTGKHVLMPAMLSIFNLNRNIPAMNLSYEVVVHGTTVMLEDDLNNGDVNNGQKKISISQPITLINNRPIVKKFLIYAPTNFGHGFHSECTIDLIFWADNVPLYYTSHKVSNTLIASNVTNVLSTTLVYENKPSFEIAAEDGEPEQKSNRDFRAYGINTFEKIYRNTAFAQKLK